MNLNERIEILEKELVALKSKIKDLSANTEQKYRTPVTIAGGNQAKGNLGSVDISARMGQIKGGSIIWNTSEINNPRADIEPPVPDKDKGKGYNKHSHTRFSGGALIKGAIEIVEFDWTSTTPVIENIHSQQFWQEQPKIKKDKNIKEEPVDKIGLLDLFFNPDGGYDIYGKPIGTWGIAAYEIDVKKCYLVERVTEIDGNNPTLGEIKVDSKGQEMKSSIYNTDQTKNSIIWDENGNCWRFLAVYASGE